MKHFLNQRESLVTEAVETAVRLGEGKLARLDGFPGIKVVVRTDADARHVAVVSGGGAGHEPAHVGFVGEGMLTAAVSGEVFASPSVDAVLAGIVAVTGDAGCLLVVKNYTGDRLNFGLAAEKARALGKRVEMVVVGDDVAIEGAHPRGIAGTLFVHKVAGHAARSGASLADVKAAAERAATAVKSIGLSLSSVEIPGHTAEERLGPQEVELGLGIHGEPGAKVIPLASVDALAETMVATLLPALAGKGPCALLVNNHGGVSPLEMATVARARVNAFAKTREVALVFGPAPLMTSLDMRGISLTALPLDAELEAAVGSPVGPRAWPPGVRLAEVPLRPLGLVAPTFVPSAHPARRVALESIARTLVTNREALDALDAKVGDGDAGTTFAAAGNALLAALDALPFADAPALAAAIADRLSKVMGGSSGILLAIFTAAVGSALAENASLTDALAAGVARIQEYGGAKPGDRTMLDALVPAIAAWRDGGVAAAARAARAGAEKTATMAKANAGRSSYVRAEALAGVPDPGAVAVAVVLEALAAT